MRPHGSGGKIRRVYAGPKETVVIASDVVDELKKRLAVAYGERLHAVVLFGSEVRGDARPDSDIDVLAVLETLPGDYGDELERGLAAVYPVALKLGRRVSVKPLAREEYERGDSPLLREVRRSGVAA
jgi:predicted nucleotidyltransferase